MARTACRGYRCMIEIRLVKRRRIALGHDFSRAETESRSSGASAPEGVVDPQRLKPVVSPVCCGMAEAMP